MDNTGPDLALAAGMFALSAVGATFLAIRFQVAVFPYWVISFALVIVGIVTRLPESPLFLGQDDGTSYLAWADEITLAWTSGNVVPGPLWPGKGFFPLIIAAFQTFVGPTLVSLIVFNSIAFSFATMLIQRATSLIFGLNPKWTIVLLTLSNASVLLHAPAVLRESIFWLGLSMGVLSLAYYQNRFDRAGLGTLILAVSTLLAIRPNFGLILSFLVVTTACVLWIFRKGLVTLSRTATGLFLIVGASLATFLSYPVMFRTDDLQNRVKKTAMELSEEGVNSTLFLDRTTAPDLCSSSELFQLACEASFRLPAILFGPFPWELGADAVWIFAILSGVHWLVILTTSTFVAFKLRGVTPVIYGLYALAGLTVLVLSVAMTNYGIIVRFRVIAEIFLLPLSLAYIQRAFWPKGSARSGSQVFGS